MTQVDRSSLRHRVRFDLLSEPSTLNPKFLACLSSLASFCCMVRSLLTAQSPACGVLRGSHGYDSCFRPLMLHTLACLLSPFLVLLAFFCASHLSSRLFTCCRVRIFPHHYAQRTIVPCFFFGLAAGHRSQLLHQLRQLLSPVVEDDVRVFACATALGAAKIRNKLCGLAEKPIGPKPDFSTFRALTRQS